MTRPSDAFEGMTLGEKGGRRFIVIPGPDPGIPTDSGAWGDPRIKSGDDGDEKSTWRAKHAPAEAGARHPHLALRISEKPWMASQRLP
jgi:hypothetical protein